MRKIILLLVILLLLPYTAFADDGSMLDLKRLLTHTVEFEEYECEFGGTIDYKVHLKNQRLKDITMWAIFVNGIYSYEVDKSEVGARQTKIVEVKDELVLPYYQWYPKEDGFYTDMYLDYGYEIGSYDEGFLELYFCEPYETTALKITNLNDGSDYIEISGIDEIGFIDFKERYLPYTDTNIPFFKFGYSTQQAKITNISDKEIELISGDYEDTVLTPLNPGESIDWDITVKKMVDRSKPLRNSELLSFNATFLMDDKYYGVSNQRVYQCRYIPWEADLKLDVTVFEGDYKSYDDNYVFCKIDITNKGLDIPDFRYLFSDQNLGYMHEMGEHPLYEDDFYYYGTFKKGDTISIYNRVKKNSDIFGCFASTDSITNYWEYFDLSNSGKETGYYGMYYDGRIFSLRADTKQNEETNASQNETGNEADKQKDTKKEEQVIETSAEKPQSTPQLKPPRKIDTQRIASMPLWVGIVLGISLLGSIGIIIALRKKQD